MTTKTEENIMGTMDMPKLLVSLSLPMMISMLIQALYNIVDSMFVARLNEEALTAISLVYPVQALMLAVALGTGVGINALLSRSLGEGNREKANRVAKNGIFISLVTSCVFLILGNLSANAFFRAQTSDALILRYGTQYMRAMTTFAFGICMQITFERLLQSTGKTLYNMISQGTGAIVNILLDPIFIFGLFGFPRLEVLGAAVATIIGQACAVLLALTFNITKNREIALSPKGFKPHRETIKEIYKIGFPAIVMQSIISVMSFFFNRILLMFTETATAVFGVYFKLQSFIFMPVFGLTNGLIPIAAYNYGAKKPDRIRASCRLSFLYSCVIMLFGTLLFRAVPEKLLGLFNASPEMLEIGVPALKIISLSFVIVAFDIVASAMFQALGRSDYSLIASVTRQLLFLLPIAYYLAKTHGLTSVWWSFTISEALNVIISGFLLRKIIKDEIRPLEEKERSVL